MSLLDTLSRLGTPLYNARPTPLSPPTYQPQRTMYHALLDFYQGNDLYASLLANLRERGIWHEAIKPLRNVAFRVVEFHAAHLWPGPLPDALHIETNNKRLAPAIEQLWTWSNWQARKQVAARYFALYGDLFIKVAQTDDKQRVYLQVLQPGEVTDFQVDERDFLTWVRIDTAQMVNDRSGWRTEIWDKDRQDVRIYLHTNTPETPIAELGPPADTRTFASFGVTFVPIVHAKFRDMGDLRGIGCFTQAIDKMIECDRMTTRLHQLLFRNAGGVWALEAGGVDKDGRPIPPLQLRQSTDSNGNPSANDGRITIGDDRMIALPGNGRLVSLIPQIPYGDALAINNAMVDELEKDLPELVFPRLREKADLSGRAVRLLMSDAIARVEEARHNAMAALVRAHAMAITIAQAAGLRAFAVGTYEEGALNHVIEFGDVVPLDESEKADVSSVQADAIIKWMTIVGPRQALIDSGKYAEGDVERIIREKQADDAAAAAAQMAAFERGQGGGFGGQQSEAA